MAEYGKENNVDECEALKRQISELKNELKENEVKYKADINNIIRDNAINEAIRKANAKTDKVVRALIDMDSIEIDENGKVSGLNEQIEKLKGSEDTNFLFEKDEYIGANIGNSSKEPNVNIDDMNYTQMCAYLENM